MMTSKHYIAIAAQVSEVLADPDLDTDTRGTVLGLVAKFADLFSVDNPRFNRTKFILACATNEGN